MEVIAVIMAAMASLRRNIVMPVLAWRLCKMASENRQVVEIDVERLTGAVHIRFDGRAISGSLPLLGIEVDRREEIGQDARKSLSASASRNTPALKGRQERPPRTKDRRKHNKSRHGKRRKNG